jgi:GntR family transcriptional regulator / MocR family aminotransferase
MAKTTSSFDLVVRERPAGTTLFQWVYNEVRSAILDGRLRRGKRLPSTRELSRFYRVSRGTVVTAFEQLHAEGYLESSVGAGTYVNTMLPEDLLHAKRDIGTVIGAGKVEPSLSQFAQRLGQAAEVRSQPARAFRAAEAALDAFPITLWAQIASRRLQRATRTLLADVDPRGYRPLREAISNYLGTARGVRCTTNKSSLLQVFSKGWT